MLLIIAVPFASSTKNFKLSKEEEGNRREKEERIKEYRNNDRSHGKYSEEVRTYENIICNYIIYVNSLYGGVNMGGGYHFFQ